MEEGIFFGITRHRMEGRGIFTWCEFRQFIIWSIDEGDFYVNFKLRNKNDNSWVLVAIYGAVQPEFK